MKVLVTGGTGYLGRIVVAALAARRHDLVVFARSATRSGLPGLLIDGDVRDRAALEGAARGCDAICHMAALVSIWRRVPADFDDVNVGGLENALAAASTCKVSRVLYASSFLALAPRDSPVPIAANDYARTKILADQLANERVRGGSPIVRVYPGVIYGPGSMTEGNLVGRLIADHLKGRLPGLVGPDKPWSFSFVEDVARGFASALERGGIGGRYRLGGENASQLEAFELVKQLTGRPVPRRLPFALASAIGTAEEWRVNMLGGLPLITRGAVEIFRHDWSLDSSLAVRELDYTMTPLADGLQRTIEALGR